MDTRNLIISTKTTLSSSNSAAAEMSGRATSDSSPFFAQLAAAILIAFAVVSLAASAVFAAMTSCQHCQKQVDDANSVCPYCLGDLSVPAVNLPPANKNVKKAGSGQSLKTSIIQAGNRRGANDEQAVLITEQQLKVFLEDTLLKRFHANHANQIVKIENIRRDAEDGVKFKVVGTAFNSSNKPLNTVGKFIEILDEQAAIVQANLNHAAKVDINDPTTVSYTLTLKIDPKNSAFSNSPKAAQPLDFTFVVPPSQSDNVTVKILKINADSESILYNMQNKAGDKVTLNLIAEAGMKIVVMIDDKTVYEKNY